MNDNELNELIEIRDNAPKCTTIGVDRVIDKSVVVDGDGLFWSLMDFNWWCWSPSEKRWELDLNHKPDIRPIRSLSDINTIIQLEQQKRELESQIEFKIKECMELAQACNRWKNSALTQKGLTNEDN